MPHIVRIKSSRFLFFSFECFFIDTLQHNNDIFCSIIMDHSAYCRSFRLYRQANGTIRVGAMNRKLPSLPFRKIFLSVDIRKLGINVQNVMQFERNMLRILWGESLCVWQQQRRRINHCVITLTRPTVAWAEKMPDRHVLYCVQLADL